MPRPCSALSSNRELFHAGPWPSLLVQYGEVAAGLPQMEEQPVALEMNMRSPQTCVTRRAYAVSAQPAQEPENSSSGCLNWLPLRFLLMSSGFSVTLATQ